MEKREICFIISLAPRSFLRDWEFACECLRQTVASLLHSENPSLMVVIAGNESPMKAVPADPRVHFISIGESKKYSETALERRSDIIRDKAAKTHNAWEFARKKCTFRYVMKVDADDFVSRRLVGFLADRDLVAGYVITDGWVWPNGNRFLIEKCERFERMSGTSVILQTDFANQGVSMNAMNSGFAPVCPEVIRDFGSIVLLSENHPNARNLMSLQNVEMHSVPFQAAVYRVCNVNSISQRGTRIHSLRFLMGKLRRLRLITPALRQEFTLPSK